MTSALICPGLRGPNPPGGILHRLSHAATSLSPSCSALTGAWRLLAERLRQLPCRRWSLSLQCAHMVPRTRCARSASNRTVWRASCPPNEKSHLAAALVQTIVLLRCRRWITQSKRFDPNCAVFKAFDAYMFDVTSLHTQPVSA